VLLVFVVLFWELVLTAVISRRQVTSQKNPVNESEKDGNMIINMECGNFGSRRDCLGRDLPLTEFDHDLNNNSNNKNHQLLEKQISGMYLGEITRLILKKYMNIGLLFKSNADKLNAAYEFTTEQMSRIEADMSHDLNVVKEILTANNILNTTIEERKFVKSATHLVARRAGQLAAVQIAAIYKQIEHSFESKSSLVAAIDGSVFEKYPGFSGTMAETLHGLLGENKIKLVLAKDGSGNGAALASVANFTLLQRLN